VKNFPLTYQIASEEDLWSYQKRVGSGQWWLFECSEQMKLIGREKRSDVNKIRVKVKIRKLVEESEKNIEVGKKICLRTNLFK
jgi:hypothetical protein